MILGKVLIRDRMATQKKKEKEKEKEKEIRPGLQNSKRPTQAIFVIY